MSHGGWAPTTQGMAVTVDGESLDVADLILLGVLTGEWPAFEHRVGLGLELERANPGGVAEDAVRREATAFRYAHGLISAADFRGWLEERQLNVSDVSGVLRRRLLRVDHPDPNGPATADDPRPHGPSAADEEVVAVLPAEAFCDGVLARLADLGVERLVAGQLVEVVPPADPGGVESALASLPGLRVPLVDELGDAELQTRLSRLVSLGLALEQLRREVAEPRAIGRRMKQHALDWTALVGDELRFPREGAAREARLQIAADGDSAAAVADRADVAVLDRRLLVGEAPATVGVSFAAAAVGEVIGPWEEEGLWHVLTLRAKVPPSPEDSSLRERATEELLRERIGRHGAGRITRHVPL
jgi:hypothetical protein